LSGFKKPEDLARLNTISVFRDDSDEWASTRTGWVNEGNSATFNVSGHNNYYDATNGDSNSCLSPALELGCKMMSADRVAQVLSVPAEDFYAATACLDINKFAEETALKLLATTSAGQNALDRYQKNGRKIFYGPDFQPVPAGGPFFVNGHMTIKDIDWDKYLGVDSMKLGP